MKLISLATASVNQTPLDWSGNLRRIIECIRTAKSNKSSILCLPELAITGYGCEDQFLARDTTDRALKSLEKIIPETRGINVAVGLPLRYQNTIYNTVAMLSDGKLLGFYAKQNLAGDGLHYETRWFSAWPAGERVELTVLGKRTPLGDLLFDLGDLKIGFEICEDAWIADRPGRRQAEFGVDIILNPSASHFAFAKQQTREQFVREGSRAFGVAYVYANLLGNESGRAIYDGGSMIASNGQIVAQGPRLSFDEARVTTAIVDIDLNRLAQVKSVSRQTILQGAAVVEAEFSYPKVANSQNTTPPAPPLIWSKEVEFTRAVALGLFDYMRKSRSNGFVVSLSGGADSAAVACLVKVMHNLICKELNGDEVAQRLSYIGGKIPTVKSLLTCVYQVTENSGEVTRNAAQSLASAIGADYSEWNVQPVMDQFIQLAESTIQRPLNWQQDDITLQNIQARVRAPGAWMLANLRNALLLATSNRSEAAVGYATMDGDTCGGLSPLAGIDKAFLRQWLTWLEKEGAEDIESIPQLRAINRQQPTAELRPSDQEQTDEDDLMPYPILDLIERMAIRDKQSPREVYIQLISKFPDTETTTLKNYVIHFFKLWCRNQWKRERYAPSFHVDDENLDPKTWCRFPILNAGFEDELTELQQL